MASNSKKTSKPCARLKAGSYKASPIKRVWIEKDKQKKRPIGLSEIEDKLVQKSAEMLLSAVYGQDFYEFSYGFIEGKSAHQRLKKVRKTIQALREWCRENRHKDLNEQYRLLCSKLRGHFQYFGIRCNLRAMEAVLYHAIRNWKYWLNRRSRKKALNWEKYRKLLEQIPLPTPRIIHNV